MSNKVCNGGTMQPAKRPRKRIASVLILALGVTAVAVTASGAFGRAGPARAEQASSTGPVQLPCTAKKCMWNRKTPDSNITVVPTRVPAGSTPSFSAPTSNPAQGNLHGQRLTGVLDCAGYQATDPGAFQFYLGATFRGDVAYKVTYTVNNASPGKLQFCLGATFQFTTSSGKPAKSVTLPNELSGFAGLVPSCAKVPGGPCLVSKSKAGQNTVLKLLIPAVKGADPWGRS